VTNPLDQVGAILQKKKPFDEIAKDFCTHLRKSFAHYNWVGIYMIEGETLVLKAWDGPAATEHVRIPIGHGICGLAAREKRSVLVDDVTKDPRYLQCFLHTKSEIVVPIFAKGKVAGEIDIDGDKIAAYNDTDRAFLEWCAERLGAVAAR
jgi:GAF domain-containing protein